MYCSTKLNRKQRKVILEPPLKWLWKQEYYNNECCINYLVHWISSKQTIVETMRDKGILRKQLYNNHNINFIHTVLIIQTNLILIIFILKLKLYVLYENREWVKEFFKNVYIKLKLFLINNCTIAPAQWDHQFHVHITLVLCARLKVHWIKEDQKTLQWT